MSRLKHVYGLPFRARNVSVPMGHKLERSLRSSGWVEIDMCPFGPGVRSQVTGSGIASALADAVVFVSPDLSTSRDAVLQNRGPIKGTTVDKNLLLRLSVYGFRACWVLMPSQILFTVVPTPNISPTYYDSFAYVASCLFSDESHHKDIRDLDVLIGSKKESDITVNTSSMVVATNTYLATQLLGMDLSNVVHHLRRYIHNENIPLVHLTDIHY